MKSVFRSDAHDDGTGFRFEILSHDESELVVGGATCSGVSTATESQCSTDGTDDVDGPVWCPR